jgi:hypothetical protein
MIAAGPAPGRAGGRVVGLTATRTIKRTEHPIPGAFCL